MKKQSLVELASIIDKYDIIYIADKDRFRVTFPENKEEMYLTDISFVRYFGTKLGIQFIEIQIILDALNGYNRLFLRLNSKIRD